MTGEQLKEIRLARKMTQKEFSELLGPGASYSSVTKWETGQNPIPQWVIDKLRDTSGVFRISNLTLDETAELERIAARNGVSADSLVAGLVRAALKFGVPLIVGGIVAGFLLKDSTSDIYQFVLTFFARF